MQITVNRSGLELATYNITFELISGAHNKADDFLSRLVKLPHDRQATVQMLTATIMMHLHLTPGADSTNNKP